MTVAELIAELRARPQDAEAWVRVNINGNGCLDVIGKVYSDDDGDVVVEGESQ